MLSSYPERLRFLGIDLRSRTRRRLVVALTYGIYWTVMVSARQHEFSQAKMAMWIASAGILLLGIFRDKGPVKHFDLMQAPKSTMFRAMDKVAKQRYGVAFDDLPGEKRIEVMLEVSDFETGKDLGPMIVDPDMPDERELVERNKALVRTLQVLTSMLIFNSIYVSGGGLHFQPDDLVGWALIYVVAAVTLPKAIILWTADDPRKSEELELARKEV